MNDNLQKLDDCILEIKKDMFNWYDYIGMRTRTEIKDKIKELEKLNITDGIHSVLINGQLIGLLEWVLGYEEEK